MLIYGRIYLITNSVNKKQYIGKTVRSITCRFSTHCCNAKNNYNLNMLITKAIKKYGKENFVIEEIDVAYSKKELKLLEGVYISWFNTLVPNGYNLTNVINGKSQFSEETIEKIRIKANEPERLKWASENGKKHRGKIVKNSSSKYIGVLIRKNRSECRICYNNKTINIGVYKDEIDAAKAYDIAAIKYFGNDCILNFPELRQDYIESKILVKKNNKSQSGIEGIWFENRSNRWRVKYFNKLLNKNGLKYFKKLEDAIKFKESL